MRFYVDMGHEIGNAELCFSKITFFTGKKVKHILLCAMLIGGKKVLEVNENRFYHFHC